MAGQKRRPGQIGMAHGEQGLGAAALGHGDGEAGRVARGDPSAGVRVEARDRVRVEQA